MQRHIFRMERFLAAQAALVMVMFLFGSSPTVWRWCPVSNAGDLSCFGQMAAGWLFHLAFVVAVVYLAVFGIYKLADLLNE